MMFHMLKLIQKTIDFVLYITQSYSWIPKYFQNPKYGYTSKFYKSRWERKLEGRLATWENKDTKTQLADKNSHIIQEKKRCIKHKINERRLKIHSKYKILGTAFVHLAHLSKCLLSTRTPCSQISVYLFICQLRTQVNLVTSHHTGRNV